MPRWVCSWKKIAKTSCQTVRGWGSSLLSLFMRKDNTFANLYQILCKDEAQVSLFMKNVIQTSFHILHKDKLSFQIMYFYEKNTQTSCHTLFKDEVTQ